MEGKLVRSECYYCGSLLKVEETEKKGEFTFIKHTRLVRGSGYDDEEGASVHQPNNYDEDCPGSEKIVLGDTIIL
jgi:hypothetical protein